MAVRLVDPATYVVWNSQVAHSLNDGALWAGRGANVLLRGGLHASWHPSARIGIDVRLVPELTYSRNHPFPILTYRGSDRSAYASPWHGAGGLASADLPLRFGDQPITRLIPGQSSVRLRVDRIAAGVATESHWWGPGMRNALILSGHGEGFPHGFVRTAEPLRIPGGHLEAVMLAGVLSESPYFDTTRANDLRSISAAAVTYRLHAEPGLTIGVARSVIAPIERAERGFTRSGDVLARWEHVRAPTDTTPEGRSRQQSDQLLSLFGRWAFAPHGFEFYAEWARLEVPRSLREWLVAPQSTQGYTLGLQWIRPLRDTTRHLRLHGEATNLELSTTFTDRPPYPDFYAGRATAQGFTHRGQVLGAAIGPGASSQWLAADYFAREWGAGLMLGRIRWENDALYREIGPNYFRHDVSLLWGVRGGGSWRGTAIGAEITAQRRLNYLFQNSIAAPGPRRVVDLSNLTIALSLSPARPWQ